MFNDGRLSSKFFQLFGLIMQPFQPGQVPPSYPLHNHDRTQAPNNAQQCLIDAVEYASKEELPLLLDRALQRGANLNFCSSYNCNVLVKAARANKPWAISMLMARGADLPLHPPNAVDMLMEACRDGHLDLVRALIDVAHMSIVSEDHHGKTALHYAVISESPEIVGLLLENGAETDALAKFIPHDEIPGIFPPYAGLNNSAITPLMIAAAQGNVAICEALLEHDAKPDHGGCSALLMAALHKNKSSFNLLLARGAKLSDCHDEFGHKGLAACIMNHVPVEYLRKLVNQHNFSADEGAINSLLGNAIVSKDQQVIALLMACDIPVEAYSLTEHTVWDLVLPEGIQASHNANLLTAGCNRKIKPEIDAEFLKMLADIIANCSKPASLASKGIFTSLLVKAMPELRRIADLSDHITSLQCALMTCWLLKQSLPLVPVPFKPEDMQSMARDEQWHFKTEKDMYTQGKALSEGSAKVIQHCMQQLQHSLTLEFFLSCAQDCPDDRSLASFMRKRLAENSGVPTAVIQFVVDAWMSAAQWTKDWLVAPDSMEDGNRFLLALTHNLMLKKLDDFEYQDNALVRQCIETIKEALPIEAHPLSRFCSNPVKWLRQLENRSNLRPVNVDELTNNLELALGLPVTTCRNLANIWKNAIDAAGRSPAWHNPAELQQFLERLMALNIYGVMTDENSSKIMPKIDIALLEFWKSKVFSTRPAATQGQKRTAEDEAPGAPPRKEARN